MSLLMGALILVPFLGGLFCVAAGKKKETLRDYLADGVTVLEFLMMLAAFAMGKNLMGQEEAAWRTAVAVLELKNICGMGIHFQLDGFRLIYGLIASFMWMMA